MKNYTVMQLKDKNNISFIKLFYNNVLNTRVQTENNHKISWSEEDSPHIKRTKNYTEI